MTPPFKTATLEPMPGGTMQHVRQALGPPRLELEDVLLYEGDCLEMMAGLLPGQFALTVTSPPYNIGKEYERTKSTAAYLDWCADWIAEVARLTCDTGAFWLNLGYLEVPGRARAIPIPYLLWDRVPLFLVQEVVWHYGAGVAARHAFSPRNEKFLWYVKDSDNYYFDLDAVRDPNVKYPNQFKNGRRKVNPLGKNPTDVWSFPKVTSGSRRSSKERTAHPAQFPSAVIERIVKACSPPGGLILDPFMGSGTVAEVARRLGRKVVGFEIEPRYLEIAERRLAAQGAANDQIQLAS